MADSPLVMIPPLLCDARVFLDQIGALSSQRPVMVVPSMAGETIKQMAEAVLASAPAHFALAAAGMGGAVALDILDCAPERVTRVALINVTAQADTPTMASDRETQIIAAKAGRFDDVIAHELDVGRLHEATEQAPMAALFRQMGRAVGADRYVQQARAMQRRKDQQAVLRKIKQPALVISGASDPDLPLRRQEFIAEMIPYARHEVIENAGMMPSIERAGQVSEILLDWMKQPLMLR